MVKINTCVKQLVAEYYYTAFQKCQKVGSKVIITSPCRLLETARCLTGSKLMQGSLLGYLLLLGWYLAAWQTALLLIRHLASPGIFLGCLAAAYSCLALGEAYTYRSAVY